MSSFEERMNRMTTLALELTSQEWSRLGLDELNDVNPYTQPTSDKGIIVERLTALFMIRCVTLVLNNDTMDGNNNNGGGTSNGINTTSGFKNIATTTVCQQLLDKSISFPSHIITETVVRELQEYIRRIIDGYKDVPYHNREHAFHVVLSVNKLIDMMVSGKNRIATTSTASVLPAQNKATLPTYGSPTGPRNVSATSTYATTAVTYGLRRDPVALFSMLFAALIHDVEQ